jgi:hypothetical protein
MRKERAAGETGTDCGRIVAQIAGRTVGGTDADCAVVLAGQTTKPT